MQTKTTLGQFMSVLQRRQATDSSRLIFAHAIRLVQTEHGGHFLIGQNAIRNQNPCRYAIIGFRCEPNLATNIFFGHFVRTELGRERHATAGVGQEPP